MSLLEDMKGAADVMSASEILLASTFWSHVARERIGVQALRDPDFFARAVEQWPTPTLEEMESRLGGVLDDWEGDPNPQVVAIHQAITAELLSRGIEP